MKDLFRSIREKKALRTAAAKGLSLLLAVSLFFSVLPLPAFALSEADFEVIWLKGKYDEIAHFSSEGFAMVCKNGKVGFIDTSGREVVPCLYNEPHTQPMYDLTLEYFYNNGWAVMSKRLDGEDVKHGCIDSSGRETVPFVYDFVYPFHKGLAMVQKGYGESSQYGYIDQTGKEVIPCIYDDAPHLSEDFVVVRKGGKSGVLDRTGAVVIPFIYDGAEGFSEGLACVEKNGKWGYIDQTGKKVIPFLYDGAEGFSEGLACVEKNGKWGYIDQTGKEVIPFLYDDAWDFAEGLAWVQKDGKRGYIDQTGKEVIPLIYDGARGFSEGLARVEKNGKWGYIDQTGKEVIPFLYDDARGFAEGLAWVKKDGKEGCLDQTGREVIPCLYDYVNMREKNFILVGQFPAGYENSQDSYDFFSLSFGIFSKSGKEILPCISDGFLCLVKPSRFGNEGLEAVGIGGKVGFIDVNSGELVVPTVYTGGLRFSDGLARVSKGEGMSRRWGYVDKTGKEVIPCIYDEVGDFGQGVAAVKKDGEWFLLRRKTGTLEKSKILINGVEKDIEAYEVWGDIYYKPRDIAYLLSGSKSQFDVVWNKKKKQTEIKLGKPYIPVGTELSYSPAPQNITSSKVSVFVDGSLRTLSAQIIDGSTYYKLSELASIVGFKLFRDKEKNTVSIRTKDTRKDMFYWINLIGSDSTIYNHELAKVCAEFSQAAEQGTEGGAVKTAHSTDIVNKYLELGFDFDKIAVGNYRGNRIKAADVGSNGASYGFAIGYKPLNINGEEVKLVLITARGSSVNWEFIMDRFTGSKDHNKVNGYSVYDVVADFNKELWKGFLKFTKLHPEIIDGRRIIFVVNGHSLGGAAANLFAAKLTAFTSGSWAKKEDIHCYTFGAIDALDTTKVSNTPITQGFENIFNIFNILDDFGVIGNYLNSEFFFATNAAFMTGKFGIMKWFEHDFYKTIENIPNHDMEGYRKILEPGAVIFEREDFYHDLIIRIRNGKCIDACDDSFANHLKSIREKRKSK